MKRLATAIALVLFVTALPAATTCCVAKPACKMAAIQATMSCCARSCTMTSPDPGRDRDATLTIAPSPQIGADSAVTIVAPAVPEFSIVAAANDHQTNGFSSRDPVLLNAQFRI